MLIEIGTLHRIGFFFKAIRNELFPEEDLIAIFPKKPETAKRYFIS